MFLRSLLRVLVIAIGVSAAGGYWLHQRATTSMAALITELRPHALLRYERLMAWPGGRVDLYDVTLEPVGSWRPTLGLPIGYRVAADQVRLKPQSASAPDRAMRISVRQLQAEVVGSGPVATALGDSTIGRVELTTDATLRWQAGPRQLDVEVNGHWPQRATVSTALSLIAGPDFPAATPNGNAVIRLAVRIDDLGLADAVKQGAALRARLPVSAWEQRTIQDLARRAQSERWTWSPESAEALYRSIRAPQSLQIELSPLNPARLDLLSLYAPGDRWALLGAEIRDVGR